MSYKPVSMQELCAYVHKLHPGQYTSTAILLAIRDGKVKKVKGQYLILEEQQP